QRPAARLDRPLRRVHEGSGSPGRLGPRLHRPRARGARDVVPRDPGAARPLPAARTEAAIVSRARSAVVSVLVLLVGRRRRRRPRPDETRLVPALPPTPAAE